MLIPERMANLLDPTPSGPNTAREGAGTTLCLLQLKLPLPSGTCLERGLLGQAQAWLGCILHSQEARPRCAGAQLAG